MASGLLDAMAGHEIMYESGASVSQQCILSEPMALTAGIRTVLEGPKPASRLIRLR